jgi:hypothetical protein
LALQNRLTDFSRFVGADTGAKEKNATLTTPPNNTLEVRNCADMINMEGLTNGITFPPSRRKDGNIEQEATPTSRPGH